MNNPLNEAYIRPYLNSYLENIHLLPSPQEFNRRLKKIVHLIGWNRVEFINEYRGRDKKPTRIKVQLKDHISSKYMRKGFISIMIEMGHSKEIIKTFTGHRGDRVIDHYIQVHKETKKKVIVDFKLERR